MGAMLRNTFETGYSELMKILAAKENAPRAMLSKEKPTMTSQAHFLRNQSPKAEAKIKMARAKDVIDGRGAFIT